MVPVVVASAPKAASSQRPKVAVLAVCALALLYLAMRPTEGSVQLVAKGAEVRTAAPKATARPGAEQKDSPAAAEATERRPCTCSALPEPHEQSAHPSPSSPPSASFAASPARAAPVTGARYPDPEAYTDTVDGTKGLHVLREWQPKRSVLTLNSGVPGAPAGETRLVVDDWTAYMGPGGAEKHVPALPLCSPLANGHLAGSVLSSSFVDLDVGPLVLQGANDYTDVMVRGQAGPGVEDTMVRSLLWHRVTPEEEAERAHAQGAHMWVGMMPDTRAHYCGKLSEFRDEFKPHTTCDGARNESPYVGPDYCFKSSEPAAIVSYDCGVVESGVYRVECHWDVYSLDAGGRHVTYNRHNRFDLGPLVGKATVEEYDELAVPGTAVYIDAGGHFFNEILPRLIHMDTFLPPHIPLVWSTGPIVDRVLGELRGAGILSAERKIVQHDKGPHFFRAKRLYVYQSSMAAREYPLLLASSQRLMTRRLHEWVAARPPFPVEKRDGIVLLSRPAGARCVTNQDDLLRRLREEFSGKHILEFQAGYGEWTFLRTMEELYWARVVIGPHGANLNNWVGMRPGSTVVEFGFDNAEGFMLPADYFCLARNLGLRYWMSLGLPGAGYSSPMTVRVDEVVNIVKTAYDA